MRWLDGAALSLFTGATIVVASPAAVRHGEGGGSDAAPRPRVASSAPAAPGERSPGARDTVDVHASHAAGTPRTAHGSATARRDPALGSVAGRVTLLGAARPHQLLA